MFKSLFAINPIDRTNTLKNTNQFFNKYKLDLNYKTDKNLNTIIKDRVEFLSQFDNLILFWSGGIDSTLVFYALIEDNIKFDIVISENSKKEYEMLFNKIINIEFPNNIKEIFYFENFIPSYVKDKIIVTGEIGDQIMGSMKYLEYSIEQLKEVYTKHISKEFIEVYDDSCQLVLKNNEATLAEYLWSLNFIFKYVDVIERFPKVLNNLNIEEHNVKLAHFFHSKDFQAWSIQYYKEHCNFDKIQDYKIAYKQFIFNINGDIDYFKNKIKHPSLDGSIIKV